MADDKFFKGLKEKVDKLENESDKDKMKNLIVDMVKFSHRDDVQIHHVLVDARARSKEELGKPY